MTIVVFITAKDHSEAKKLASVLVEKKLIACANIVKGIESIFRWEGKIDFAKEALLILKTERRHFKKIVAAVKAHHSYSVPEVIALPVVAGNKDYLKWVKGAVK